MIFSHTWEQVLSGKKTVTRRLVMPSDNVVAGYDGIFRSIFRNHRFKWQLGHTYAVQLGRGQKAVGRIRITDIRRECVQDISEEDAIAEGCPGQQLDIDDQIMPHEQYAELWDSIHTKPGTRWEDNPPVWVLTFELVRS